MKIKVVVDTNAIDNPGLNNKFFGRRKELLKIINKIDLYVPEIVIKEIKEHKRKCFNTKVSELARNELFKLTNCDIDSINKLSVTEIIASDFESEDIPYTILKTGNIKDFFDKFEQKILRKEPPFGKDDDRGIKDALIAYSVDSLLETLGSEERIILVSNDSRLKEYFEKNSKVRTTNDITRVLDLIEHDTGITVKTDNVTKIEFAGIREKSNLEKKIDKMLTNLRNSVNFSKTHEFISILKRNESFLTKDNKADIIRSALNNNQIRWIIEDQDIYEFLMPIYYDCSDLLTKQEQFEFETIVGISHNFTFAN